MKKKIKAKSFFILFIFCGSILSAKVIPLPGLNKPSLVMVNNGLVIIADFPHVHIYNLSNFKKVAKIGKAGEGPKEFAGSLRLQPHPEYIVIGSRMKVSYYTKEGVFVKEVRSKQVQQPMSTNPWGKIMLLMAAPGKITSTT